MAQQRRLVRAEPQGLLGPLVAVGRGPTLQGKAHMKNALFLATALGIAGLALVETDRVAWATQCFWIGWPSQPTCDDDPTATDSAFAFTLNTTAYSDFNCTSFDFTLNVDWTPANSPNIDGDTTSVTPSSFSVYCSTAFGSLCAGSLDDPGTDGTLQVSAWDSPSANCSGAWNVTIKHHPTNC